MSRIRSRNTKPEMLVRKFLVFQRGDLEGDPVLFARGLLLNLITAEKSLGKKTPGRLKVYPNLSVGDDQQQHGYKFIPGSFHYSHDCVLRDIIFV